MTFSNSSVNYTLNGTAGISGATGITMNGTALVNLQTSNSFTGPVAINAGAINISNSGALGNSSNSAASATVASGAALQIQGGIATAAVPLVLSGAGLASSPAGALDNVGGANTYSGAIALGNTSTITASAGTLTLAGGVAANAYPLTFNGPGAIFAAGTLTANSGLTVGAAGTLTLNGAGSTISGGSLNINQGGTLAVAGGDITVADSSSFYMGNSGLASRHADLRPERRKLCVKQHGEQCLPGQQGGQRPYDLHPQRRQFHNHGHGDPVRRPAKQRRRERQRRFAQRGRIPRGWKQQRLSCRQHQSFLGQLQLRQLRRIDAWLQQWFARRDEHFRRDSRLFRRCPVHRRREQQRRGAVYQNGGLFTAKSNSVYLFMPQNQGYGAYILSTGTFSDSAAQFSIANNGLTCGLFSQSGGSANFSNAVFTGGQATTSGGSVGTGVIDVFRSAVHAHRRLVHVQCCLRVRHRDRPRQRLSSRAVRQLLLDEWHGGDGDRQSAHGRDHRGQQNLCDQRRVDDQFRRRHAPRLCKQRRRELLQRFGQRLHLPRRPEPGRQRQERRHRPGSDGPERLRRGDFARDDQPGKRRRVGLHRPAGRDVLRPRRRRRAGHGPGHDRRQWNGHGNHDYQPRLRLCQRRKRDRHVQRRQYRVGLDVAAAGSFTLSATSQNSASGGLTLTGNGVLTLGSTANSYGGPTTINAGTLQLGGAGALPNGNTLSVGGMLDLHGYRAAVGALSGSGVIDNRSGSGVYNLTVGLGDASGAFSGTIQNSSGTISLTKTGQGMFALSGSNAYTGATVVAGGTLQIGGNGIANGEALASRSITVSSNATVAFNPTGAVSYSGTVGGAGQLAMTGSGLVTLYGPNVYSGPTTISGGTLELGTGDNLPAATALTIAASGVFDLAGNVQTVGSLSGSVRGDRRGQSFPHMALDADGLPVLRLDNVRREHHRQQCVGSFRQRRIGPQRLEHLQRRDDRQRRNVGDRRAERFVRQRFGDDRRGRAVGFGQRRGDWRIACGLVAGRFRRGCLECGGVDSGDARRI